MSEKISSQNYADRSESAIAARRNEAWGVEPKKEFANGNDYLDGRPDTEIAASVHDSIFEKTDAKMDIYSDRSLVEVAHMIKEANEAQDKSVSLELQAEIENRLYEYVQSGQLTEEGAMNRLGQLMAIWSESENVGVVPNDETENPEPTVGEAADTPEDDAPAISEQPYYEADDQRLQAAADRREAAKAAAEAEAELEDASDDDLEDEIGEQETPRRYGAPSGFDATTGFMSTDEINSENGQNPSRPREAYDAPTMNPVSDPAIEPRERRSVAGTVNAARGNVASWIGDFRNRDRSSNTRNGERRSVAGTANHLAMVAMNRLGSIMNRHSEVDGQDDLEQDSGKKKRRVRLALGATVITGLTIGAGFYLNKYGFSLPHDVTDQAASLTSVNGTPTSTGLEGLHDAADQAINADPEAPADVFHFPNDPQAGLGAEKLNEVAGTVNGNWNIPQGGGLIDAMERNGLDSSKLTAEVMNYLLTTFPDEFEPHTYANGVADLWVSKPGDLSAAVTAYIQSLK